MCTEIRMHIASRYTQWLKKLLPYNLSFSISTYALMRTFMGEFISTTKHTFPPATAYNRRLLQLQLICFYNLLCFYELFFCYHTLKTICAIMVQITTIIKFFVFIFLKLKGYIIVLHLIMGFLFCFHCMLLNASFHDQNQVHNSNIQSNCVNFYH